MPFHQSINCHGRIARKNAPKEIQIDQMKFKSMDRRMLDGRSSHYSFYRKKYIGNCRRINNNKHLLLLWVMNCNQFVFEIVSISFQLFVFMLDGESRFHCINNFQQSSLLRLLIALVRIRFRMHAHITTDTISLAMRSMHFGTVVIVRCCMYVLLYIKNNHSNTSVKSDITTNPMHIQCVVILIVFFSARMCGSLPE